MHSMHHQILVTETIQLQQQQQQQSQPQVASQPINHRQHQHQQANEDQQTAPNMTVLETLEPVLSVLDPVVQHQHQQQQQQQQQEASVIHGQQHLGQAPQLHQLQAPSRNQHEQQMDTATETTNDTGGQGAASHEQAAANNGTNIRSGARQTIQQQHRSHIEGIVADGGGPIVQWLLDNYEIADGESLPRSTVYNHYLAHCRHLQMASVNAASFGKLIRSVFVGLKTRRLGTRGHSKYHYFGVRAKQHVRLDWLQASSEASDHGDPSALSAGPGCSTHHDSTIENRNTDNGSESPDSTADEHQSAHSSHHSSASNHKRPRRHHHNHSHSHSHSHSHNHNHSHSQQQHHLHNNGQRRSNACGGDNYSRLDIEQHQQGAHHPHPHLHLHPPPHHQHLNQLQLHSHSQQQQTAGDQINPHNHSDDQMLEHLRHQHPNGFYSYHSTNGCESGQLQENGYNCIQQQQQLHDNNASEAGDENKLNTISGTATTNFTEGFISNWPPTDQHELATYRSHLGDNWSTLIDDHWPQMRLNEAQQQQQQQQLWDIFEANYKAYYKRMLELLNELKFADIEQLWFEFWHPANGSATTANTATSGAQQPQQQQQLVLQDQPTTVHWTANVNHNHHHLHHQHQLVVQCRDQMDANEASQVNTLNHHSHHQHLQQQQQQQQQHHQPPPSGDHLYQATEQQQSQASQQLSSGLSFHQLYQLTSQPNAIERINQIDYCLYAALEFFLVPDLLGPMPRPLAHQLRTFAKSFGPWLELATRDYAIQFASEKSKSARAFGHALRRYTSINHLATASRAVWDKRPVLAQMSLDLNRIDLRDLEHQVSLMSQAKLDQTMLTTSNLIDTVATSNVNCSLEQQQQQDNIDDTPSATTTATTTTATTTTTTMDTLIHSDQQQQQHQQQHEHQNLNQPSSKRYDDGLSHQQQNKTDNQLHQSCSIHPGQLIQNFLHLLQDPYPANSWPAWCRNLAQYCGQSVDDARNFILKWNFYISLIMKELTLKSAPSLGSFQLIRLLFDEYIYYLVASKLARAQNKTFAQLLQASTNFDGV